MVSRSCCPIAASLDILGDRWTLVILRDVLFGGRSRFSQLGADESIATNILSERLERLEREGILGKDKDPSDGRRNIYFATPKGIALIPVLVSLAEWGVAHIPGTEGKELAALAKKDRDGLIAGLTAQAKNAAKKLRKA